MFGDTASSIGRGGTGVASMGVDFFSINPAAISGIDRIALGLNYGTIPIQTRYINPDVTLSYPTSYGTVGGSFRYLGFSNSDDFTNGYGLSFGMGKEIAPGFLLGASFSFFYGSNGGSTIFTGGRIGAIYRFGGSTGSGFGLFDPGIGLSVHFGAPFGEKPEYSDFNSLRAGYQVTFFRHTSVDLTFFNEVTAYNYRSFPVSLGLEALLFDRFAVRAGGTVLNEYDYGDFTAGLGYRFSVMNLESTLNYSLCYYREGILVHNVGITFLYGITDVEPPETAITPDLFSISPNNDGIQDYATFTLDVSDASSIKGWRLQILDQAENLVKEFQVSDRDMTRPLTFTGFLGRLFGPVGSALVPRRIIWDGADSAGKIAPDGVYAYRFNAWDNRNNIAAMKRGVIYVDNSTPRVEAQCGETLFTPNGDGIRDEMMIQQNAVGAYDDLWDAEFKGADGKVFRHFKWTGYDTPKKLYWDGRDDSGNPAPEGIYDYFISSRDKAGNVASARVKGISLSRNRDTADISVSAEYFSNRVGGEIVLSPSLSSKFGLEYWGIAVSDSGSRIVKEFNGYDFEKSVTWDGRDKSGKLLDDGVYTVSYSALFKNGDMIQSFNKSIVIDSTPPDLDIDHTPCLFSPDGDGDDELLSILSEGRDESGIKEWKISVFAPSGDIFKTFQGRGNLPAELIWNGRSDSGEIVESAADYFSEAEATDLAGNYSRSARDRIPVDVLVLATDRGLNMQVSNITFVPGEDKLTRQGRRILRRAAAVLRRYERYRIVIECHTDDLGNEEYNLDLTERRARTVMNFCIDRGLPERKMTFLGMGETTPLFPNTGEENRRRNRRVEFHLLKE